jgi:hypothetical protein
MKKALVDPNTKVKYISSWTDPISDGKPYLPVYEEIENSQRLAEVANTEFPVASPLFWIDCPDEAIADEWYYDSSQQVFSVVPLDAIYPNT